MSMMQEFKKFAMRGNVVDMAVGIIIGIAFGAIITTLVNDVIMPPIGVLLGGVDFSGIVTTVEEGAGTTPPVLMKWGVFLNAIINFLIVAFVMFLVIKSMNAMKKKEEVAPAAPTTKACPECAMTIPVNAKKCGYCSTLLAR